MKNLSPKTSTIVRLHLVLTILLGILSIASVPASWLLSGDNTRSPETLGVSDESQRRKMVGSVIRAEDKDGLLLKLAERNIDPVFIDMQEGEGGIIAVTKEDVIHPKINGLRSSGNVTISPNYEYSLQFIPNDPLYPNQWNLPRINAPEAWEITRGSSGVVVAVLDSGILFNQDINGQSQVQPDFPEERMWVNPAETGMTQEGDPCWTGVPEDKRFNNCDDSGNGLIDDWQGWDFMGGFRGDGPNCPNYNDATTYQSTSDPSFIVQDNDPQPYSCDSPLEPNELNRDHFNGTCRQFESACFVGHGTMVASVLSAETDNNQLIAGVDHNVSLMNIRVFDGYGVSNTGLIAAGVNYAISNGADVINMSLGGSCSDETFRDSVLENLFAQATEQGIMLVAASGNNGHSTLCYPASSEYVMAVGATNINDERASYSNWSTNNLLDVTAPANVPVANAPSARDGYSLSLISAGGTSFAAPHVAGLASLLLAEYPDISLDDLWARVKQGTDKLSNMNGQDYDPEYGFGRINLLNSLEIQDDQLEDLQNTFTFTEVPIYRLYNASTRNHFYTASARERDRAVSIHGFRYEGIAFSAPQESEGTIPVYRLYRPSTRSHFYTASARERDRAVSIHGFRYEGIAFRAPTTSQENTRDIYRLYRPSAGNHFYTASARERDRAVSIHGFRYEGVEHLSF